MPLPTPPNGKYFTGNFYLSDDRERVNVAWLYQALGANGWTIEAVAGMCGNTHVESTTNPGIWQNLAVNKGPGYGLTQWTPFRKYTDWCAKNGLEKSDMESAVKRLLFEVKNPSLQWVIHDGYPETFEEFTKSTKSPRYLAGVFFRNYEMANNSTQPEREDKAQVFYNFLLGQPDPSPDPWPEPTPTNVLTNRGILPAILIRRRYIT